MPHLVRLTRKASPAEAADALEAAFVHLAMEVLTPEAPLDPVPRWKPLRKLLARRVITLSKWSGTDGLVETAGGARDRGEVEAGLRRLELLVLTLRAPPLEDATHVVVDPTSSRFDATGKLAGKRWVLRVFGGADVANDDSVAAVARDFRAVSRETQKLYACRPEAWTWAGRSLASQHGSFEIEHTDRPELLVFRFEPR